MILTQLLMILLFITLLLLITGIIVGLTVAGERGGPPIRTEFDTAVKGLIAIIVVTGLLGIFAPVAVLWFGGINGLALVTVIAVALAAFFTVALTGVLLILFAVFRNRRRHEAAEQWAEDEDRRLLKRLKLKNLYRRLNNYYLDNNLFGLSPNKTSDTGFLYAYAHEFLAFHDQVSAELEATDIRLMERFQTELAGEFEVCTYLLRFEEVRLVTFYKSVLDYYPIFRDELARRAVGEEGRETYSAMEVLWVVEAHVSKKVPGFMEELNAELMLY